MGKHGLQDGALSGKASTVYSAADLGELAVRLGSIVSFDRRGNVIFLDSFENGLQKWQAAELTTGAAVYLSNAESRYGGQSALFNFTGGTNAVATLPKTFRYPVVSRVGVEVGIRIGDYIDYISVGVSFYDGENLYTYAIKYVVSGRKLYVYDGTLGWYVLVGDLTLYSLRGLFHEVKLVVDLTSNVYTRLLLNEETYDLSSYAPVSASNTTAPRIQVRLSAAQSGADDAFAYFDGVIITQNEPA